MNSAGSKERNSLLEKIKKVQMQDRAVHNYTQLNNIPYGLESDMAFRPNKSDRQVMSSNKKHEYHNSVDQKIMNEDILNDYASNSNNSSANQEFLGHHSLSKINKNINNSAQNRYVKNTIDLHAFVQ